MPPRTTIVLDTDDEEEPCAASPEDPPSHTASVGKLKAQIDALKQGYDCLLDTCRGLEQERKAAKRGANDDSAPPAKVARANDASNPSKEEEEAEMTRLQKNLADKTLENERLEHTVATLTDKIKKTDTLLAKTSTEAFNDRRECEQAQRASLSASNELSKAKAVAAKAKDEANKAKAETTKANKATAKAQEELTKLQAQLAASGNAPQSAAAPQSGFKSSLVTLKAVLDECDSWLTKKTASINTNPQYNTEREIRYDETAKEWQVDHINRMVSGNANLPEQWDTITDAAVLQELNTKLGRVTPKRQMFRLRAVGSTATYSFNGHSYEATITTKVRPWLATGNAAPVAPTPNPVPNPVPAPPPTFGQGSIGWGVLVQGGQAQGDFIKISAADAKRWHDAIDGNEPDSIQVGAPELARLIERFSALSQGYKYDEKKSKFYSKPSALKTFLKLYIARGYSSIRVVFHGMRGQNFDDLFNDPLGPNMQFASSGNRYSHHGSLPGFYVGLLDAPAAYYTAFDDHLYGTRMPFGTCLVMLSMEQTGAAKTLVYEDYNLNIINGNKYPNYHCTNSGNDARVVKDTTVLLPVGLAVAR